ncbi:RagB/SusD family nutrient uptake outer membrane protein [Cesiribacter andamanensis]|uniref:SusD family protein n=1 Tax=Cesiribacter andamanensis AMV16 TaxID=1279009 RepID=M7N348_9BACT|nr:RagB/SusD family nutrient uptake outer membrane protein [Cesiribacter andamanensis]EMR01707.1 SusD family protein [Cesiribacter andamanensis AMV16]
MKKFRFKPLYFTALAVLAFGCTDLQVEETDSLLVEDETGNFAGVNPGPSLSSAYGDLRGFGDQANLYALLEVTSDELLVPTRGTDWGDNGQWRTLHQHTWSADHVFFLNTWNTLNSNVYRLNQLLSPVTAQNFDITAQQTAEGKVLRAYNMFLVLDLWGQIPYREATDDYTVDPIALRGAEAVDFILNDLNTAIPDLPSIGPSGNTLQASKAAGHFLRAKVLLNRHIYEGREVNAADMDQVIASVDAIAAEGFDIERDMGYFEIFEPSIDSETIFWTNTGVGNRMWNGLHYYQTTPDNTGGGWNGFSTTAEFYALFEGPNDTNAPNSGQEERRGYVPTNGIGFGFLVGQQYDREGNALTDRSGNPLVFTPNFAGIIGNNERHGIRVLKYHPYNGAYTEHHILFRYADAHLMKAEAYARKGDMATALTLINELREVRDASPLANLSMMDILDERGRELYIEGWRRNDQIRFGDFTTTWPLKENTEEFRVLFPLPPSAVASNPNLEQNPGY